MSMRARPDGTLTFTTPEWDAEWYWPVGTRVSIPARAVLGTVTKRNSVTVRVQLDDGRTLVNVSVLALVRT